MKAMTAQSPLARSVTKWTIYDRRSRVSTGLACRVLNWTGAGGAIDGLEPATPGTTNRCSNQLRTIATARPEGAART